MPEHDCLPADVSASDLVVHLGEMSGLPHNAARERAADVLRHVGLAEERYRPIGGYSTGMKQRVKLAQALVHDPRLVLLDEPTNGLDPRLARRHAGAGPPHRRGLRHRRPGHLPPARRAGADQRPRRRPRRRPAAALVVDRGLHPRHRHARPRGARRPRRAGPDGPCAGGRRAGHPQGRPAARGGLRRGRDPRTWCATSRSTSTSAWSGSRSGTTASRTCSAPRRPAVSNPSEPAPPTRSGVIHDLGYRPYAGPRLGERAVAWSLFLTGLRNCYGLGGPGAPRCCRCCCSRPWCCRP